MASSSTSARSGGRGCRSRSSCTHAELGRRRPAPATDELIASAVPEPARGRRRRRAAARAARARARRARVVASAAGPAREPDRRGGDAARAEESKSMRWRAGGDAGACGAPRGPRSAPCSRGSGRSAAVALWARHLRGVREPTVFEWHVKGALAPVVGPTRSAGAGGGREPSPGHGRPGGRRAVAVKAAAGRARPAERGDRPLGAHPRAGRARPYDHGRN